MALFASGASSIYLNTTDSISVNFSSQTLTLIFRFLAGQGFCTGTQSCLWILLLRWLSVEAYAQYSVAFGFQNTLGVLVDLGISGSIVALVGDRGSDKEIVGTIQSAKYFRNASSLS